MDDRSSKVGQSIVPPLTIDHAARILRGGIFVYVLAKQKNLNFTFNSDEIFIPQ